MDSLPIERRRAKIDRIDATDDDWILTGLVSPFNVWTDLGPFRERILPGAFAGALTTSDVPFLVNHAGLPLARNTTGTMDLEEQDRGLVVTARLARRDPDVQRLIPKVERGDLDGFSWAMVVPMDGQEWTEDGRSISRVAELRDVSIVTDPAYPTTEVLAARSRKAFVDARAESDVRRSLLRAPWRR